MFNIYEVILSLSAVVYSLCSFHCSLSVQMKQNQYSIPSELFANFKQFMIEFYSVLPMSIGNECWNFCLCALLHLYLCVSMHPSCTFKFIFVQLLLYVLDI